ncbi:MAG: tagaturonate epimerase family protein [Anaerolineae bacterium]
MKFGKLEMDPARNPAVLDTATWDVPAAWARLQALSEADLRSLGEAVAGEGTLPSLTGCVLHENSCVRGSGTLVCLATLADGQNLLLQVGPAEGPVLLGEPLGVRSLDSIRLAAFPATAAVVDRFCHALNPLRGPRPLGAQPALGIGTRMTTAVWPGIWRAMSEGGFAANAIQNSVRELNLLDDLLSARPAPRNMAYNFGLIESGYTGSTYEGLWLAGVLDALKAETVSWYGADADHIQVKRGPEGLARAFQVVEAARYYTFFTLDVSDVLGYAALTAEGVPTGQPDGAQRAEMLSYHRSSGRIGGLSYRPDEGMLLRLAHKYGAALDAAQALVEHITALKQGRSFDLELSIDEHPPEVATFDCLTSPEELAFVLQEARRRGLPLTHVAPNLGVDKGVDYGMPDGLEGLEPRGATLSRLCEDAGVMLDVHSGDDLSVATRQTIRRATGGRCHFKVSPMLQILFAEALADHHPRLFRDWWQDALAYARREAENGSVVAQACIAAADGADGASTAHAAVFHQYGFAYVGRRDLDGQFAVREAFYTLSPDFYADYADRVVAYLCGLAEDVLG